MHISLISSSSKMTTLGRVKLLKKTLQTDIYDALNPSRENRGVNKQVRKDTQKARIVRAKFHLPNDAGLISVYTSKRTKVVGTRQTVRQVLCSSRGPGSGTRTTWQLTPL